jgi:hypothetical protein
MAALISVTPLLAPSLSMSWTSRTRISSLMRGPSLAAGCGVLIGRRMGLFSFASLLPTTEDREFFGSSQRQCAMRAGVTWIGHSRIMIYVR